MKRLESSRQIAGTVTTHRIMSGRGILPNNQPTHCSCSAVERSICQCKAYDLFSKLNYRHKYWHVPRGFTVTNRIMDCAHTSACGITWLMLFLMHSTGALSCTLTRMTSHRSPAWQFRLLPQGLFLMIHSAKRCTMKDSAQREEQFITGPLCSAVTLCAKRCTHMSMT